MSERLRRIRDVRECGGFTDKRKRLTEYEAAQLKEVVRRMRIEEPLPSDDDVADIRPPCVPVWRRPVPDTGLWLYFEASHERIWLWSVKVPEFFDPPAFDF